VATASQDGVKGSQLGPFAISFLGEARQSLRGLVVLGQEKPATFYTQIVLPDAGVGSFFGPRARLFG
jgi:hypothetical protein